MRKFMRGDRVRAQGLTVSGAGWIMQVDMIGTYKCEAIPCSGPADIPVMVIVVGDDGNEVWVQPHGLPDTIDAILTLIDDEAP